MSTIFQKRRISRLSIGVATGLLAIGVGTAAASNRGAPDIDALVQQLTDGTIDAPVSSQQSTASAWSETSGDHGISVTTTTNGSSTTCMAVEWKRENGGIKKWQYRCDAPKQP
jgi:hypothetical protein